jgi:hypothetical protein
MNSGLEKRFPSNCSQMEAPPLKPTLVNELSGDRMDVGDVFTIGRSSDCDLVIESGRVSRKHAMIRRESRLERGTVLLASGHDPRQSTG